MRALLFVFSIGLDTDNVFECSAIVEETSVVRQLPLSVPSHVFYPYEVVARLFPLCVSSCCLWAVLLLREIAKYMQPESKCELVSTAPYECNFFYVQGNVIRFPFAMPF